MLKSDFINSEQVKFSKISDSSEFENTELIDVINAYRQELNYFNKNAEGSDKENEALAKRTFMPLYQALMSWGWAATHDLEALAALKLAEDMIGDHTLSASMVDAAFSFVSCQPHRARLTDVITWYKRETAFYNEHSVNCGDEHDALADKTFRLPYLLLRNWNLAADSPEEATEALRLASEDLQDEGLHTGLVRAVTLFLERGKNSAQS